MGLRLCFRSSRGSERFINWLSLVSLALAVMLFIVVSSVYNGLYEKTQEQMLAWIPHGFVHERDVVQAKLSELSADHRVRAVSDSYESQVYLFEDGVGHVRTLYGHSGALTKQIEEMRIGASAHALEEGVVLTKLDGFSRDLGELIKVSFLVSKGDHVQLVTQSFPLVGLVSVGSWNEKQMLFLPMSILERLRHSEIQGFGTRIHLKDPLLLPETSLNSGMVRWWTDLYGALFSAYKLEKVVHYGVMVLVMLLATFASICSQTMLINRKKKEIGILLTLGAEPNFLSRVFAVQGSVLAIAGLAVGLLVGLAFCYFGSETIELIDSAVGSLLSRYTILDEIPIVTKPVEISIGLLIASITCAFAITRPLGSIVRTTPIELFGQVGR